MSSSFKKFVLCSVVLGFFMRTKLSAQLFLTAFPTFGISSNAYSHLPFSRQSYLRYLDEPRMLQAGLDFSWKGLEAYLRFELFQNPYLWQTGQGYSNLTIPINNMPFTGSFNANFPSEGWFGYVNDYFDISIGRRKLSMGPGKYGLTLDQHTPSLDGYWIGLHPMANYKIRVYGLLVGAMSNMEANRRFLAKNQRYWDSTTGTWVDSFNPSTSTTPQIDRYDNAFKGYFVHKIGLTGENWRVGLSESIMVYGGAPSLDIISPVVVWHNSYFVNANALLGVTFESKLPHNVRFYGEWAMDDLSLGEFDSDKPTAMSYMLGTDWQVFSSDEPYKGQIYRDTARMQSEQSFRATDGLIIGIETVYTSRYMYGRPDDDPFGKLSFFTVPQYGVNRWPLVEYYLAFPYGPQSYIFEFNTTYSHDNWYIEASLAYLMEGYKGLGIFDMDDPNKSHDPDVIPNNAAKNNPYFFDGPLSHSIVLQFMIYYYLRDWVQFYAATYQRIRIDDFSQSISSVSLGLAFHLATDWLLSDANRKEPHV